MIWLIFLALTGVSILSVLFTLSRPKQAGSDIAPDLTAFETQRQALEAALAKGEVDEGEAAATRTELARRLLVSARHLSAAGEPCVQTGHEGRRRLAAFATLVFVPLVSFGLYQLGGTPGLPDQFSQLRTARPIEQEDVDRLVERLRRQLVLHPENAEGWDLLGRVETRRGRLSEAAEAFSDAIRYGGESTDRLLALGQAQLALSGGLVDGKAREVFERAAKLTPSDPRTDFFLSLVLAQDGKMEESATRLASALLRTPQGTAWLPLMRDQLAQVVLSRFASDQPFDENKATPEERAGSLRALLAKSAATDAQNAAGWRWRILARLALEGAASFAPAAGEARAALVGNAAELAEIEKFITSLSARS